MIPHIVHIQQNCKNSADVFMEGGYYGENYKNVNLSDTYPHGKLIKILNGNKDPVLEEILEELKR